MVIAIGPYKMRICKRRMAWQLVYLVQSDETSFGSFVTSASTQRCLIHTRYCGGVTEDFSLVLLLLHVCTFQGTLMLYFLAFVLSFFLTAWSLSGLHTLCILRIASIVARGYVGSLDLGNLVQWPLSPIAKCLLAKTSHLILSAFLISRTARAEMVSVLLFYMRTFVPIWTHDVFLVEANEGSAVPLFPCLKPTEMRGQSYVVREIILFSQNPCLARCLAAHAFGSLRWNICCDIVWSSWHLQRYMMWLRAIFNISLMSRRKRCDLRTRHIAAAFQAILFYYKTI